MIDLDTGYVRNEFIELSLCACISKN